MGQSLSSLDTEIQERFADLLVASTKTGLSETVVQLWQKFKENKLEPIDMKTLLGIPQATMSENVKVENCRDMSLKITKLLIKYKELDRRSRLGGLVDIRDFK